MASCLRNVCVGLLVVMLPYFALAARDSQGKEFILGFMENKVWRDTLNSDIELFVTTASDVPVIVTVTTPLYNESFRQVKTVYRGFTTMFTIPHGIRGVGTEKSNKGVLIQATEEVTVYAINKEVKSTDAYIALPVDVLGTEYYAVTYVRSPEVLVVATEDNTLVNVSCPVSEQICDITFEGQAYKNGAIFTVLLNKFETFHTIPAATHGDYTGTHITSDKPVSVISGNKKVKVADERGKMSSADHLTEQMMPVTTWGTQFNTPSTPYRDIGDFFRVVASQDGTSVWLKNGTEFLIDKAGHFVEFNIPSREYQTISSSAPILVAMFSKTWQGNKKDGELYGDPAMSMIIPEPQYASDYTFSTVREATGKEYANTVLVIVDKAKMLGLRLDGKRIQWSGEKAIMGNSKKVHLWVNVTAGSHTLNHVDPRVTFMALASGVFLHNSYAYLAGLRLAEINAVCLPTVNTTLKMADIVDNDCDKLIDEELLDGIDNDGDGLIDEDLAQYPSMLCGDYLRPRFPSPCWCTSEWGPIWTGQKFRALGSCTKAPVDPAVNGYLSLFRDGKAVHKCQITGDPHLVQFGGRRASIPFPCQYEVARLRFNDYDQEGIPTFNQSVMEVNITASNGLSPIKGQYYVDVVSVSVVIVTLHGVRIPVGNFTTWSYIIKSALRSTLTTPTPEMSWYADWATRNAKYRSRIRFGEITVEEQMAELTISGISLRVQFRPYNDKKLLPGVTVEVAGDVIPDDSALYPATMCSTVQDKRSPVLSAWGSSVSTKDAGLYAAVKQTLTQTIGEGQNLCSSVVDAYRDCASNQNFALGNCSKALSDPAVLKCASSEEEDFHNQLRDDAGFDIFRACLDVYCVPSSRGQACERLQSFDADCPGKWPEISEVICPKAVI